MMSDHNWVHSTISHEKPAWPVKELSFRKLRNINHDKFEADIMSSALVTNSSSEIEAMAEQYQDTLSNLLDQHAPLTTKIIKVRNMVPWYNDEIKQAKRTRRQLESLTKFPCDHDRFKKQRKIVSQTLQSVKSNYYHTKITECGRDSKSLYSVMNSVLDRGSISSLPSICSVKEIVDSFSTFFTTKVQKIRDDLNHLASTGDFIVTDSCHLMTDHRLSTFKETTDAEIHLIIMRSASKSCSLESQQIC